MNQPPEPGLLGFLPKRKGRHVIINKKYLLILLIATTCLIEACETVPPTTTKEQATGSLEVPGDRYSNNGGTVAVPRFVLLGKAYQNSAFLDKGTGLIWTTTPIGIYNHNDAVSECQSRIIGGHAGWALPAETALRNLTDLYDPNANLQIPTNAPFSAVYGADGPFWASTKYSNTNEYFVVGFDEKQAFTGMDPNTKLYVVCVHT